MVRVGPYDYVENLPEDVDVDVDVRELMFRRARKMFGILLLHLAAFVGGGFKALSLSLIVNAAYMLFNREGGNALVDRVRAKIEPLASEFLVGVEHRDLLVDEKTISLIKKCAGVALLCLFCLRFILGVFLTEARNELTPFAIGAIVVFVIYDAAASFNWTGKTIAACVAVAFAIEVASLIGLPMPWLANNLFDRPLLVLVTNRYKFHAWACFQFVIFVVQAINVGYLMGLLIGKPYAEAVMTVEKLRSRLSLAAKTFGFVSRCSGRFEAHKLAIAIADQEIELLQAVRAANLEKISRIEYVEGVLEPALGGGKNVETTKALCRRMGYSTNKYWTFSESYVAVIENKLMHDDKFYEEVKKEIGKLELELDLEPEHVESE